MGEGAGAGPFGQAQHLEASLCMPSVMLPAESSTGTPMTLHGMRAMSMSTLALEVLLQHTPSPHPAPRDAALNPTHIPEHTCCLECSSALLQIHLLLIPQCPSRVQSILRSPSRPPHPSLGWAMSLFCAPQPGTSLPSSYPAVSASSVLP